MSRLTRDGTAEPVSRDQILRHARGQGNVHFPCSAGHEQQDWQPYPVDPYSAICDDHTYILPNPCCETKFSGANADRETLVLPVQLTTCRNGNLTYPVDLYPCYMCDHTYIIHRSSSSEQLVNFPLHLSLSSSSLGTINT